MKVDLLCGRQGIGVELPERALLFESRPAEELIDSGEAVVDALRNPIGIMPIPIISSSTSGAPRISTRPSAIPTKFISIRRALCYRRRYFRNLENWKG